MLAMIWRHNFLPLVGKYTCPKCNGAGEADRQICGRCHGTGTRRTRWRRQFDRIIDQAIPIFLILIVAWIVLQWVTSGMKTVRHR